jgi:hypothetical protein
MGIKDVNNPLYGREWRGGRGYVRNIYTIKDISNITGRTVGAIRNDMSNKGIDKENSEAVFRYVARLLATQRSGVEIVCKVCGSKFKAKTWNHKYCSKECFESTRPKVKSTPDIFNIGKDVCSICGYNKYIECLEWHHLIEGDKLFQLSGHTGKRTVEEIEDEKKKCVVLCCNCHQEIHRVHKKKP